MISLDFLATLPLKTVQVPSTGTTSDKGEFGKLAEGFVTPSGLSTKDRPAEETRIEDNRLMLPGLDTPVVLYEKVPVQAYTAPTITTSMPAGTANRPVDADSLSTAAAEEVAEKLSVADTFSPKATSAVQVDVSTLPASTVPVPVTGDDEMFGMGNNATVKLTVNGYSGALKPRPDLGYGLEISSVNPKSQSVGLPGDPFSRTTTEHDLPETKLDRADMPVTRELHDRQKLAGPAEYYRSGDRVSGPSVSSPPANGSSGREMTSLMTVQPTVEETDELAVITEKKASAEASRSSNFNAQTLQNSGLVPEDIKRNSHLRAAVQIGGEKVDNIGAGNGVGAPLPASSSNAVREPSLSSGNGSSGTLQVPIQQTPVTAPTPAIPVVQTPVDMPVNSTPQPAPISSNNAASAVPVMAVLDTVMDEQWLSRLGQEISQLIAGRGAVSFQLKPAFLGNIQVEIATGEGGDRVQLATENEQAKSLIVAAQGRLEQDIRLAGGKMTRLDVSVNDETGAQLQQNSAGTERHQEGSSSTGTQIADQSHEHRLQQSHAAQEPRQAGNARYA